MGCDSSKSTNVTIDIESSSIEDKISWVSDHRGQVAGDKSHDVFTYGLRMLTDCSGVNTQNAVNPAEVKLTTVLLELLSYFIMRQTDNANNDANSPDAVLERKFFTTLSTFVAQTPSKFFRRYAACVYLKGIITHNIPTSDGHVVAAVAEIFRAYATRLGFMVTEADTSTREREEVKTTVKEALAGPEEAIAADFATPYVFDTDPLWLLDYAAEAVQPAASACEANYRAMFACEAEMSAGAGAGAGAGTSTDFTNGFALLLSSPDQGRAERGRQCFEWLFGLPQNKEKEYELSVWHGWHLTYMRGAAKCLQTHGFKMDRVLNRLKSLLFGTGVKTQWERVHREADAAVESGLAVVLLELVRGVIGRVQQDPHYHLDRELPNVRRVLQVIHGIAQIGRERAEAAGTAGTAGSVVTNVYAAVLFEKKWMKRVLQVLIMDDECDRMDWEDRVERMSVSCLAYTIMTNLRGESPDGKKYAAFTKDPSLK